MGNTFLEKQRAIQNAKIQEAFECGFQKCFDLMVIVLNDPEFMGKNTFGMKRLAKMRECMKKWEKVFLDAFFATPESDFLQYKMDERLRRAWRDEYIPPFSKRYPIIKAYKYKRGG